MTNNNLPMTLVEYFWKASQQIVMLTPNKAPNPDIEGWGSGFLLLYNSLIPPVEQLTDSLPHQ